MSGWKKTVQLAARWRCKKDFYVAPVERYLAKWLTPELQLS